MYGSMMTEATNFRLTCDFVSILCLFFAILYFIIADGATAFKKSSCKDKEGAPINLGGHSFLFQPIISRSRASSMGVNLSALN
jgi:hypothetical protein